jgi:NADH-quinone oxidoreductase subunit J
MELVVFFIAAAICLVGAFGVITRSNPVHAALSLVMTLFGVAVLFVAQDAHFLAVVQVIVYAGAIVVLFLFVLMLLGVDQAEDIKIEPIAGQRVIAAVLGLVLFVLPVLALIATKDDGGIVATGARANLGAISEDPGDNVSQLGEVLFTDDLYAFEITSVLLVIAVVGAVLLARRGPAGELPIDLDEPSNDDEDDAAETEEVDA